MCCSSFLLPPHPLGSISFISTSPLETHRRSLQVRKEPIRYMFSSIPRPITSDNSLEPNVAVTESCVSFVKDDGEFRGVMCLGLDRLKFASSHEWVKHEGCGNNCREHAPSPTDSSPTIPASPLPLSSPGSTSYTTPPPPSRNELCPTHQFPTLQLEMRNLLKSTHFTDCFAISELGFRKCLQFVLGVLIWSRCCRLRQALEKKTNLIKFGVDFV